MYFRLTREGRPVSKVSEHLHRGVRLHRRGRIEPGSRRTSSCGRRRWRCTTSSCRGSASRRTRRCWATRSTPSSICTAHDMCRITVAWVFNEVTPRQRFEDDLTLSVESIVGRHWKPELHALLENVAMDGSAMLDLPEGRMFHPGHAIESAWMLMEIARKRGDDESAADRRRHRAGLARARLGPGVRRHPVHHEHRLDADPRAGGQSEALVAALRDALRPAAGLVAHGPRRLWQWYEKVHEYTFSHFPDPRVRRVVRLPGPRRKARLDRQGQRLEGFLSPAAGLVALLPVAGSRYLSQHGDSGQRV